MTEAERRRERYSSIKAELAKKRIKEHILEYARSVATNHPDGLVEIPKVRKALGLDRTLVMMTIKNSGEFELHSRKQNHRDLWDTEGRNHLTYKYNKMGFRPRKVLKKPKKKK